MPSPVFGEKIDDVESSPVKRRGLYGCPDSLSRTQTDEKSFLLQAREIKFSDGQEARGEQTKKQ
jgi:hypothetical protein